MFCIFVYAAGDETSFERSVPLLRYGEFMHSAGIENRLNVFFMKGLSRFSNSYREALEAFGYAVHDKEPEMAELVAQFPVISAMPTYYAYNYLRWLLPRKMLMTGDLSLPVVVVDGDIVFTAPFKDLENDVRGKTFLLQGNPCFTVVSTMDWFDAYAVHLTRLEQDPDSLNLHAGKVRRMQVRSDREACNASVYPVPIRHDQDFLQYLIGADLIPQESAKTIFDSSFYWVQNALYPGQWFSEQASEDCRPLLEERGRQLYVGRKKFAFIHFQNDFAWYAHCAYRLEQMGLGTLVPLLANEKETGRLRFPARVIGQGIKRMDPKSKGYGRDMAYDEVLSRNPHTGNMHVTDIINRCW